VRASPARAMGSAVVRAAKALGLAVPLTLQVSADEVGLFRGRLGESASAAISIKDS